MADGGMLSFALGLTSSGFVSGMGNANRAAQSFLGTASRLTGITALVAGAFEGLKQSVNLVKGVFNAFSQGAALQQLHARTGQSVADLYQLQRGFKAVGLNADEVGPMIFHLQKSMSGLSDMGENTAEAFAMLGLSMATLRSQNTTQQFEAIAKALRSLSPSSAASIGLKIFGRESAANFVQLARSSKEFAAALQASAAQGQKMEQNAAAFHKIERSMAQLKTKTEDLFAGIAEGVAPGLQAILDALNTIDLTGIGEKIGTLFKGLTQALRDAKLGELLALSLNAGLETFANTFNATIAGIQAAIIKLYENITNQTSAAAASTVQRSLPKGLLHEGMAIGADTLGVADFLSFLYINGDSPRGREAYEFYQKRKGEADKYGDLGDAELGIDRKGISGILNSISGMGKAFAEAFEKNFSAGSHTAAKAFADFIGIEAGKMPKSMAAANGGNENNNAATPMKNFEVTSFEKIGFIFASGGPTMMGDHARRTADNTSAMRASLGRIELVVAGNGVKTALTPFASTIF